MDGVTVGFKSLGGAGGFLTWRRKEGKLLAHAVHDMKRLKWFLDCCLWESPGKLQLHRLENFAYTRTV
jgi:hypothetical protein